VTSSRGGSGAAPLPETNPVNPPGIGLLKVISTPVTGWGKRSSPAWSASRRSGSLCAPYFSSPATGWPASENWTRIWLRRPVSRLISISE